jgi:YD repeat-containing protein
MKTPKIKILAAAAALAMCLCICTPADAVVVTYIYDDAGRLTQADFGNDRTLRYVYDNNGNLTGRTVTSGRAPGDVNADGDITLADVLSALKVQSGENVSVSLSADVDNDRKIGLPEAEYGLQKLADLRK